MMTQTTRQQTQIRAAYPPVTADELEPDQALCAHCEGARLVEVGFQNAPSTVLIACECCDGDGWVARPACHDCHGSGELPASDFPECDTMHLRTVPCGSCNGSGYHVGPLF